MSRNSLFSLRDGGCYVVRPYDSLYNTEAQVLMLLGTSASAVLRTAGGRLLREGVDCKVIREIH